MCRKYLGKFLEDEREHPEGIVWEEARKRGDSRVPCGNNRELGMDRAQER